VLKHLICDSHESILKQPLAEEFREIVKSTFTLRNHRWIDPFSDQLPRFFPIVNDFF